MACLGLRSSRFIFFFVLLGAFIFLFGGFVGCSFGQEAGGKTAPSSSSSPEPRGQTKGEERSGDGSYRRDYLRWNWNQTGTQCASGGIGGGAAVSGLRAENGDAGCARGFASHHTPTQAELGWGTRFFRFLHGVDIGWAGSARFRCYGRWRAELQLGLGASYFGGDRSGGH